MSRPRSKTRTAKAKIQDKEEFRVIHLSDQRVQGTLYMYQVSHMRVPGTCDHHTPGLIKESRALFTCTRSVT
jgi:hypothetical protein